MVEKESEWLLPENLRKQEEQERKAVENGAFDGGGDFGSYYAYLKGINHDFIKAHAVSDDHLAFRYAENINSLLKQHNLRLGGNIIDIGCAIGTNTNAINHFNKNGTTYGLDISEDAIKVAKNKYSDCNFFHQSADNLDNFEDQYFDVIHAREFYPFTRTNDIQYHLKYLKLFHSKLKPNGFVLLQMISLDNGLCNTFDRVSRGLMDIDYSTIRRRAMIPNIIYNALGDKAYGKVFYPILLLIIKILFAFLSQKKIGYLYIFQKRQ